MARLSRLLLWCLVAVLAAAGAAVGANIYWRHNFPVKAAPPPVRIPEAAPATQSEAELDPSTTLSEADRSYIWDIEHHGNLLNTHGFKAVANAIRDNNAAELTKLLSSSFVGELPSAPREVSTHNEVLNVVRREDGGQEPKRVDVAGFVEHLLNYRRLFKSAPPKVQLVLKTLHPKIERAMDGSWTGLAQLRLHGESSPGRPCEVFVVLSYEVSRPTKERLAEPGWFHMAHEEQSLVAQAEHYLLQDTTRAHGLDPSLLHDNWLEDQASPSSRMISTGGIFVCDFNRDGILDVLITDVKRYILYRGKPDGHFEDVTEAMGLALHPDNLNPLSGVACWIDIDGDGWDDLILGHRVYRNIEGKRFEDYSAKTNLNLPGDVVSLVVADYDRDGKLDLYATRTGQTTDRSWLSGHGSADAGNRLYRNLGNWRFEDVTRRSGVAGGSRSSFTAVWLDANNDGWPDLHVINEFGNGVLLENLHDGTFREHALGDGPVDFGTMGVAAGDINNDGNIDIYCADMYSKAGTRIIGNVPPGTYPDDVMAKMRRFVAGCQLHLNKGGFKFEQVGVSMQVHAVGWAYGPVLADLDNDGWLDVYCTAGQISRDRNKPDG